MTRKTKIIIAICGGAIVGAVGVCGVIWPSYSLACSLVAGGVAAGVGLLTGIVITKEG